MDTERLGYPILIGELMNSCPELKQLIEDFCLEPVAADSRKDA